MRNKLFIPFLALLVIACGGKKQTADNIGNDEPILVGPTFNEDSALTFCSAQCDFGPRTMNSEAHEKCLAWITDKFQQYGCIVTTQKADIEGWDGVTLHSTNVIASYNPEAKQRIIVCAHWDSRPWADNDPDSTNWHKPVMAANDGASGVGVMIELARVLQADTTKLSYGIDFVCFDAEDYGTPDWSNKEDESSWALGAQYFAKHLPAQYTCGILLDMVGGEGAKFYREGFSNHFAKQVLTDVWQAASDAGYGSFFIHDEGGTITDDHKPLIDAGIPTIDIIPYYTDCPQSVFGPTWHTVNDDIQHLDKNTLKAVGQTMVQYLYTRR